MKNKRIWKKYFAMCLAGVLSAMVLVGCGQTQNASGTEQGSIEQDGKEQESTAQTDVQQGSADLSTDEFLTGLHHIEIAVKDMGTIAVELDADNAPITVTNFIQLAESGFYDGLTFHRIIEGFMMQGGDPLGNGTGGSKDEIKGEFSENGVDNPLSHTRGAISMARSQFYDSASSQFFIVHEDSTFLDGAYAAFGYVTEGMDIVDDICTNTTGQDENGIVPMENRPIIESVKVID